MHAHSSEQTDILICLLALIDSFKVSFSARSEASTVSARGELLLFASNLTTGEWNIGKREEDPKPNRAPPKTPNMIYRFFTSRLPFGPRAPIAQGTTETGWFV